MGIADICGQIALLFGKTGVSSAAGYAYHPTSNDAMSQRRVNRQFCDNVLRIWPTESTNAVAAAVRNRI